MTAPIPRYAAEALGPAVLQLRDQAVVDAMVCVRQTLNAKVLNAAAASRCQRLLREMERAYLWDVSSERQHRVVSVAAQGEWESSQDEAITTSEAARLLDVHPRTVQRLAPTLGQKSGGRWVLQRRLVLAHKAIRESENDDRATAA